ncbi:hypothetical protein IFR09_11910 [Pseudomonas syringae]|nr:hypothetical protein [Pseudomonas syringae]MBD8577163.1 hypothetical protein [Pseudomonas syringae]MBD8792763.1 hypothetical protein [Pseudomonas syringae]MBD8803266.1 hypothetical protein [Pseudomonas syringae]MBD8811863.1 hypothetical protein [Pseudomonas syringae]
MNRSPCKAAGCIAATGSVPYPPVVVLLMPGEPVGASTTRRRSGLTGNGTLPIAH